MQISKRERRREREKKEKLSTERRHSSSRHGRGSTCDTSCFFSRESRSRNLHALIRQVLSLFSHAPPWFSLHSWPKRGAPWKFFSFFFFLFPVESRRAFSFSSLLPFLFSRLRPCKEVWESWEFVKRSRSGFQAASSSCVSSCTFNFRILGLKFFFRVFHYFTWGKKE